MSIVIALDAGHGYNTLGKRCMKKLDPDQTREWYLNDRILDLVEGKLRKYDCVVLRVGDTTGRKDISLSARVKAANAANSAVYISMHHNAGLYGRTGGGTVVFHYSNNTVRNNQATSLYNCIVRRTGLVGNRAQTVVKKNFYVLKHTNMPAFLVENGFMDSSEDVPIILSQEHAINTAEAVVDFLVKEFSLKKLPVSGEPVLNTEIYYAPYKGMDTTLSIAMKSLGLDYSYAFRKKIAVQNNITAYRGTVAQNTQMYNLLVAGLLKKA